MPSTERDARLRLRVLAEKKDIDSTIREVGRVEQKITDVDRTSKEFQKTLSKLGKAIGQSGRTNEIKGLTRDLVEAHQKGENFGNVVERAAKELTALGARKEDIRAVGRALGDASDQAERLTNAQKQGRQLNEQMFRAPGGGGGGGGGGLPDEGGTTFGRSVYKAGRSLFNAPDIGGSTTLSRAMVGIGALFDKMGITFAQFLISALPIAPAIVAAAIAVDRFNKEIAIYRSRLEAALKAEEAFAQARLNSTSDEAVQSLEEAARRREDLEQRVADAQTRMNAAFADTAANLGDLGARLLDNSTPVAQLRENYERLRNELFYQTDLVSQYTRGLSNGTFATNDAIEAERTLQQERNRTAQVNVSSALTARQQARTLTSDAAAQLMEDLQFEFDQLNGSSIEGAGKRLQEISYEMIRLERDVIPAIAARERETAAIQSFLDSANARIAADTEFANLNRTSTVPQVYERIRALMDEKAAIEAALPELQALSQGSAEGAARFREANQRLSELNTETRRLARETVPAALARLLQSNTNEIDGILLARDAKIAEIETELGNKRTSILSAYDDKITDLESAAGDNRTQIESKFQDRISKLREKGDADENTAIEDRNVRAADKAQTAREEEIDAAEKERKDALGDLERDLKRQRGIAQRERDQQLKMAADGARIAIDIERQKAQAEINVKNQALQAELSMLASLQTGVANTVTSVNAMLAQLGRAGAPRASVGARVTTTTTSPTVKSPTFSGNFGAFSSRALAAGGTARTNEIVRINDGRGMESGLTKSGRLVAFSEPMRVFTHEKTRELLSGGGARGGLTFAPNLYGLTMSQTERMMLSQFRDFVRKWKKL